MDYSSFNFEEDERQVAYHKPKSRRIVSLFMKGLSIALVVLLLPFVSSHCLPLLKPVGESMLIRLWDVLRFIAITTVVSLGIKNSRWKAIQRATSQKDDNRYRRALSLSHSIFNEIEQQKSKEGFANHIAMESPTATRPFRLVPDDRASNSYDDLSGKAALAGTERSSEVPVEDEVQLNAPVGKRPAQDNWGSAVGYVEKTDDHQRAELDVSNKNATARRTTGSNSDCLHLPGEKCSRGLAISSINEGLSAVTQTSSRLTSLQNEGPILHRRIATRPHLNGDKIKRRSSSVDHPLQRQPSRKAMPCGMNAFKEPIVDSLVKTENRSYTTALDERNELPVSSLVSKHSRSAFNLDQLNHNKRIAKSSRRNTSYSCDFGEDYSPEWFLDYPPTPPLTDPSDSETEASSTVAKTLFSSPADVSSIAQSGQSSSPVDIARSASSGDPHSPPPAALLEDAVPTSVSPSPGEVNRKADAFIARFYEHIRMQRLESFERQRMRTRSVRRGYDF